MDSPPSWLYTVAINLANSYFRRRAAERRARARLQAVSGDLLPPDNDWAIAVRHAVAALPKRQRTVLVSRYYLGLSVAETARLMDCSEGTVKSLSHKAIASLRQRSALRDLEEVIDV